MKKALLGLGVVCLALATSAAGVHFFGYHPPAAQPAKYGTRTNIPQPELSNTGISPQLANDMFTKLQDHDSTLDTLQTQMSTANSQLGTLTNGAEILTSGSTTGAPLSELNISGTKAFTLANGTYPGQVKWVECITASSTPAGTLTVTTPLGSEPSSYLFDTVHQELGFRWESTDGATYGWHVFQKRRAGKKTFTVGTNNIALGDLHEQIDLSIAATVASTFADGQVPGEQIHITISSATSTPVGSLTTTHLITKVGGTVTTGFITLNATTIYTTWAWDGAAWQVVTDGGGVYS